MVVDREDVTEGYVRRLAAATPTRGDDTPVLEGQTGRRATVAEIMQLIDRVRAEIADERASTVQP
jgi:hypothetical protein